MRYKTNHFLLLKRIFDHRDPASLAAQFRAKRNSLFKDFVRDLPKPLKILDVGGLEGFWERAGIAGDQSYSITLLNLESLRPRYENIHYVFGDGTDMSQFRKEEFDVVFSNSVIEHVGDYARQFKMGQEVRRVGKSYFIQTPNRNFPLEPHFFVPFFQFFPLALKVRLIRRFSLGWFEKTPDKQKALQIANSVELRTKEEFQSIFPDAAIYEEKFFLLAKSFIALKKGSGGGSPSLPQRT